VPGDLARFMVGVGSWFGFFGLHSVIFSSLLVVELQENEIRVGAAQSAIMVPAVLLMLIGGAVADHADRRRLAQRLHAVAALLALLLGCALTLGWLSYPLLIAYALCLGTLQAFVNPARDALLSDVVHGDLGRPVALMNTAQWGAQAAGALIAGTSRFIGAAPIVFIQAAVLLLGSAGFARLRGVSASESARASAPPLGFAQLTGGIREVARTPDLLATWVLVCGVGVLFIGPFMVVFPLMVRDVYAGGAAEIALVSAAFPLGTISGSIVVMRRGGLRDKIRAQWFALSAGGLILTAISTGPNFEGMLAGVFAWGLSASVFMIAGRTLFQERASAKNRGRVLATYTMGFMGAAGVFGAPLSGFLSGSFGPQLTLRILGSAMLVLVACTIVASVRRPRAAD
jgi:MFS family permease